MRGKALVVLALASLLTPLAALPAQSTTYCFGLPTTMSAAPGVPTNGTAGNDVILGTEGPDTIYGNGGRDSICGAGGDDHLVGGAGRDRLDGGEGADLIIGGGGHDQVLLGGGGNDTIRSTGDDTRAYGGAGDDTLIGKQYGLFQELYGGSGNDRLTAHTGYLDAYGGIGNDVLRSFSAFVSLEGNDGDDRIFSNYRNGLDGGNGFDRCSLDMTVQDTGCERVTLLCGSGGDPLPGDPPERLANRPGRLRRQREQRLPLRLEGRVRSGSPTSRPTAVSEARWCCPPASTTRPRPSAGMTSTATASMRSS